MVRKSCAYKKVHKSEELAPEECDKKGIQTAFFGLDFGVLRRLGLGLSASPKAKEGDGVLDRLERQRRASLNIFQFGLVFFGGIRPSPVENGTEQESSARHYFAQASFTPSRDHGSALPQRQAQKLP